ncbi:MAG: oxidoreductase [Mycetocola sp.]
MKRTWLITGASRGIGRSLANAVLERGDHAVLGARNTEALDDLAAAHPDAALVVALDVTDRAQIEAAVAAATERFGRVDVLVNNAGYGYRGAVEEGEEDEVRALFETNVFGPIALIKAVLPGMRERRSGAIVNISSIGARICAPGSGYYSATKAALEGISGSLQKELAPLNISVTSVEPEAFRTDFAGTSIHVSATEIDDYADTAGQRRARVDKTEAAQPGDPDKAARVIIDAVMAEETPPFLLLGGDALMAYGLVAAAEAAVLDKWREASASTDYA